MGTQSSQKYQCRLMIPADPVVEPEHGGVQGLVLARAHVEDRVLDQLLGRHLKIPTFYINRGKYFDCKTCCPHRSLVDVPREVCRGERRLGAAVQLQTLAH